MKKKKAMIFREMHDLQEHIARYAPSVENMDNDWIDQPCSQREIVRYMASCSHSSAVSSPKRNDPYIDAFTGAYISIARRSTRDGGDWVWTDEVLYYVAVHGIVPDPNFVKHVRQQYDSGFVVDKIREYDWLLPFADEGPSNTSFHRACP